MKKLFRSFAALATIGSLSVLISSCATIMNGTNGMSGQRGSGKQEVIVISSPSDATIITDGVPGVGRVQLSLARGQEHLIEVKKDGYKTVRIKTANGIVGSYFGNIALLPLGIVGEVIDLATEAAFSINPDNLIVTLNKGEGIEEQSTKDTAGGGIILSLLVSAAILALCIVLI